MIDGVSKIAGWIPDRAAAYDRLQAFLPQAGKAYAGQRNFDRGPENRSHVSALSPWIRHRLILEDDILRKTLARHSFSASEKFVQEVFWRGYFKGWLEHRPEVWHRYKQNLVGLVRGLENDAALERRYSEAVGAKTGIDCFDNWTSELVATGYLHNHARMWFASIWIFTLRLPWELGADFFYRHLLDGDPASNTCSWRWVGGLHTQGKTYLARAGNIAQYTEGRFNPAGQLASDAPALDEPPLAPPTAPIFNDPDIAGQRYGWLITEEDCSPDQLNLPHPPVAALALTAPTRRSVLPTGTLAEGFGPLAATNAASYAEAAFTVSCAVSAEEDWQATLANWIGEHQLDSIATARLPIGPVRTRLRSAVAHLNIPLVELTRDYDRLVWPHAKRGFFGLKKKIPAILNQHAIG